MKTSLIILLLSTLLAVSCETKADDIELRTNRNISESPIAQTETSPTSKPARQKLNLKIGIVDGSIGNICLRTKNGVLVKRTRVSIVTSLDESPQKVLRAVVEKKLKKGCSRYASESTDENPGENFYYSLNLKDKEVYESQEVFGIGVIEPKTAFNFENDLASIDLNNDGTAEFFRSCQGYEGVLFAIWKGKPLKGKQIWYSFYYLDYDTVPSCKKKDRHSNDE